MGWGGASLELGVKVPLVLFDPLAGGNSPGAQAAEDAEGMKAAVALLALLHQRPFFRRALTDVLN